MRAAAVVGDRAALLACWFGAVRCRYTVIPMGLVCARPGRKWGSSRCLCCEPSGHSDAEKSCFACSWQSVCVGVGWVV